MIKIQLDKNLKTAKQYSKVWMSRWQAFVMFWLSVFFIADIYYNQCIHLETLCITLVTSVVGTILGYFCKSFLETKEEKKMKYLQSQYSGVVSDDIYTDIEDFNN